VISKIKYDVHKSYNHKSCNHKMKRSSNSKPSRCVILNKIMVTSHLNLQHKCILNVKGNLHWGLTYILSASTGDNGVYGTSQKKTDELTVNEQRIVFVMAITKQHRNSFSTFCLE